MGKAYEAGTKNEGSVMLPDQAVESIVGGLVEEAAEQLLEQYRTFAGGFEMPVPIESIAEHFLGYDLEITDEGLFSDPNFLGGISFESNTIFVNASVEQHEGRYTFTIAHEIGHHVLHKELYHELVVDSDQILCREQRKKPLIERQADHFAAALIMPRSAIMVCEAVTKGDKPPSTLPKAIELANAVQAECCFSNVSLTALVNRLKDIELLGKKIPYQSGTRLRMNRRSNWKYLFLRNLRRILPFS